MLCERPLPYVTPLSRSSIHNFWLLLEIHASPSDALLSATTVMLALGKWCHDLAELGVPQHGYGGASEPPPMNELPLREN